MGLSWLARRLLPFRRHPQPRKDVEIRESFLKLFSMKWSSTLSLSAKFHRAINEIKVILPYMSSLFAGGKCQEKSVNIWKSRCIGSYIEIKIILWKSQSVCVCVSCSFIQIHSNGYKVYKANHHIMLDV